MVQLSTVTKLSTRLLATAKAVWLGGNPIAAVTALWPTNNEGKYEIASEGIRLAFTNHGASIANLFIKDKNGDEVDIVLGLDHADLYLERETNPYLNGIIGRYQGYISGASYEADGVVQRLKANAHSGTATHNGGKSGWGRQDFAIPSHQDDSITFVVFDKRLTGFPGLFVGCVTHTVTPYAWHIGYGITTILMPGGPTDLGQQVFFNLDGLRTVNGSKTVLNHKLHLPLSGLRFGIDEEGIPTGDLLGNKKNGQYDLWSAPRNVSTMLGPRDAATSALEETFVVQHKNPPPRGQGENVEHPAAILSSDHSGITMEIYTDQDALRVHTWDDEKNGVYLPRASRVETDLGADAGPLSLKSHQGEGPVPKHGAISIEQGGWPDAVNHPEWLHRKSLWGNLDIYGGYMSYRFSVNKTEQDSSQQHEEL